jgi:superfamily II DNA or RNA helicase
MPGCSFCTARDAARWQIVHAQLPVPGDHVWIRQRRWRVERARRDRAVVQLDVTGRAGRMTFLAPFDRPARIAPADRPRHVRAAHALGRLADLVAHARGLRTLTGLLHADLAILPHQLEPALAVVTGTRRVLIADEVGLGKTIQAGLVVAEILRRRFAARILVVVPTALADQWADELARRFRIESRLADRAGLDAAVRSGARDDNPWLRPGVWLASLDFLKQPHVTGSLPLRPWDLVVVDEAHGACGDSARHAVCDLVARRARHVVLLTATPHSGDQTRFGRLLDMGELSGVSDPLTVFRRTRADIALPRARAVRWHAVPPSAAGHAVFAALDAYEHAVLGAADPDRRDAAILLLSVFRKRALSTMRALAISLERRLTWLDAPGRTDRTPWLQPRLAFDEDRDDLEATEAGPLGADVGLDGTRDRTWVRRLHALAVAACRHDRKVARLTALVDRSDEPVVVFTEFRDSLDELVRRLERRRSLAMLHGGQTPRERRTELERFLSGRASLLVATDVASQGLNLQTRARWVINLELPWNPARLEQRAGRVDRIGQTRPVHVTVLVARHAAEARVASRLLRRTATARQSLGSEDVLGSALPDTVRWHAHVLTGQPIEFPPPHRTVAVCRRWVRPARVAARNLTRRRRLAAHRPPAGPYPSRPHWTRIVRFAGLRRVAGCGLLIFSTPLLDDTGATLEQHVVAVRLPRPVAAPRLDRALVGAARAAAFRSLVPRAARVARILVRQAGVISARERALAGVLIAAVDPVEAQPGLFDRRELAAFEAARAARREIRSAAAGRPECGAGPTVAIGRPALVLVIAGEP